MLSSWSIVYAPSAIFVESCREFYTHNGTFVLTLDIYVVYNVYRHICLHLSAYPLCPITVIV